MGLAPKVNGNLHPAMAETATPVAPEVPEAARMNITSHPVQNQAPSL